MSKSQKLHDLLAQAEAKRKEITNSDKYLDLADEIEDAELEIAGKRQELSDQLSEVQELQKQAAIVKSELIASGEFDEKLFKPKYKNSNYVSASAFYNVIDNHDEFMAVISIPQTVVKNYAKEHEDIKKPVLDCIKAEKPVLTDLELVK